MAWLSLLWPMLKTLLPSFLGYWVFMVLLASATWYLWTKIYGQLVFKWQAPLLAATAATLYMMMSTINGLYQSNAGIAFDNTDSAPSGNQGDMKADFLKAVETMVAKPAEITDEEKKKLFARFAALFDSAATKEAYAQNIGAVYDCQRAFWQDALATYQAKREVKSDLRKQCETKSGAFFNRAKLVPEEAAAQNGVTLANLAGRRRVPASDGNMVEVDEVTIRRALEAQIKASASVQKIFE